MCAPARDGCAPPSASKVIVVKMGGSILTAPAAYRRAAAFLRRRMKQTRGARLLAVVSAQNGHTDALFTLANEITPHPHPAALDLLWSTGELRSVALLTMCLQARGVPATGLSIHETGLVLRGGRRGPAGCELDPRRLHDALARHAVVVVPGFLAVRPCGAVISLGRGGSDLTAVLLAAQLGARRCDLVKDVAGYFDKDPNRHADAQHLPRLSFDRALRMARAGCDLVQREALEAAALYRLPLRVGCLDPRALWSWVGSAKPSRATRAAEILPASRFADRPPIESEFTSTRQETTP